MNTKGVHGFEEIIREKLERYEAPFKPDWKAMQRTLDAAKPGASGVERNLKIITGLVLLSGLVLLLGYWINQNREVYIGGTLTKNHSLQSPVQSYNKDPQDYFAGKTQNDNIGKNRENYSGIISPERKNQGNINDISSKTPGKKLPGIEDYIGEANGPVLNMLRRDYQGEKQLPAPVAGFTSNLTEGCVPLTVKFKLENQDVAMKYLWDFGDGFYSNEPNPYHIYSSTGQFNVSLTATSLINEKSGGSVMANMIIVNDLPDLKFDWDNSNNNDDGKVIRFLDHSKNVMEWYWSFGDEEISRSQNPKHIYSTEGSYVVQLVGKSALGCYDTVTSQIRIIGKNLANKFFAPNAFTPNGDGNNDEFKPVIAGPETMEYEISVFDRNGKLIFETTDINKPWDGRLKDGATEALMGTYIWLVLLKDQYGQQEKLLGQVTLLR